MPIAHEAPHDLRAGDRVLPTSTRCLVMGVVNVTPDSFSEGGAHAGTDAAVAHALALAAEGADLLDVGGESTRPGAAYVDLPVELARVLPVVERLAALTDVPISVDTRKAAVARAALDCGASLVNDVSAGRDDPDLLGVAAEASAPVVLMHMQGTPATMQDDPSYVDVVAEVEAFLAERCAAAEAAGVARDAIVVDPGIGFGKRDEHNYALLAGLPLLTRLGHPVLVGTSRKGFIGRALGGAAMDQRVEGTAATVVWSVERGARIVRVHDVRQIVRTVRMTEALMAGAGAAAGVAREWAR
ncbi:MAG TPA: dihydropteroate synthase [Actinomycetes bacterium]|nr:dihydropteroate synthase [Actinomycetes bacterium]